MRPTSICIKGQLNGPKVETMKLDGRLSAMERPYGNVRSYRSPGTLLSLKIFFFTIRSAAMDGALRMSLRRSALLGLSVTNLVAASSWTDV